MDIYQPITDYLLTLRMFETWHEMRMILQRVASTRPRDWQLPISACQAVGGSPEQAVPAAAALACVLISIILVDDMLDDDPRGEYHRIGHGRAANFAAAFQAAAMEALLGSGASSSVRLEALDSLNRMLQTTAHGQDMDVQNPDDEPSYWRVVQTKSAPFFGCAVRLGAIFGEATANTADALEQIGRLYGEMIQIHDDLSDTMAVPANTDWLQGRKPLPILFALSVDHPDRARFVELYQDISVIHRTASLGNALQEAQGILIKCGAVSYCVDQLLHRHQAAQAVLDKTPLLHRATMDTLIGGVITPVWKLFETLGISPQVSLTSE